MAKNNKKNGSKVMLINGVQTSAQHKSDIIVTTGETRLEIAMNTKDSNSPFKIALVSGPVQISANKEMMEQIPDLQKRFMENDLFYRERVADEFGREVKAIENHYINLLTEKAPEVLSIMPTLIEGVAKIKMLFDKTDREVIINEQEESVQQHAARAEAQTKKKSIDFEEQVKRYHSEKKAEKAMKSIDEEFAPVE